MLSLFNLFYEEDIRNNISTYATETLFAVLICENIVNKRW